MKYCSNKLLAIVLRETNMQNKIKVDENEEEILEENKRYVPNFEIFGVYRLACDCNPALVPLDGGTSGLPPAL